MKQLVIVGAGGHGKVACDIALKTGYDDILFLDDAPSCSECCGFPVCGQTDMLRSLSSDVFIAVGNSHIRERFFNEAVGCGLTPVTLIHPSAQIGIGITIGIGTLVAAGAVISPGTEIGNGCIINTCASVDHDCRIGDFAHVAVSAHLAGGVTVGNRSFLGIGSSVIEYKNITGDCIIGAGAVVIRDICESGTYVGVPVRKIK